MTIDNVVTIVRARLLRMFPFVARPKGVLRRADVCLSVCLSVAVSFDFPLNFTMVMGSFTQKHVLIQADQSESREGMYGPIQTDQSESREGSVGTSWPIREKGECVR